MSLPTAAMPIREPDTVWANVSIQWTRTLDNYLPSDGWQLAYYLTPPTGSPLTLAWGVEVTSADGKTFSVNCPASKTITVTAGGSGRLTGRISKGTDSAIVHDSTVTWRVIGERSLAQRIIDAIDAMLLGNASREEQSLSISTPSGTSKALTLCSKQELLAARTYWQNVRAQEIAAEAVARGLPTRRRILNRYR